MQGGLDQLGHARIVANILRTIELTELGLGLRRSVIQQNDHQGDDMVTVMREIRREKERVWERNPS